MNQSDIVSLIYFELIKVAGGATVVLAALSAFLGRVWINRIANREAQLRDERLAELKASFDIQNAELKARLDASVQRTVLVDKIQFEHEYTIYKQAWESLFALHKSTLQLRPMMDSIDPSESKQDRMKRRIGAFVAPYNAFRELIEKNKPFYPEKVYGAMDAVLEKCRIEVINYEYTERPHGEYWKEAHEAQAEIVALIENACLVIRQRISDVRVA